ncbi:MAG: HAD-IA family hydrolase [Armatimonadota bacterium]|nr:HAD-IA family hydrolase [Armatimonadota bacterium]
MKNLLAGVDAVLFDLDGTLVETNIDFARMRDELLVLAGRYEVDSEAAKQFDILRIIDYIDETLRSRGMSQQADRSRQEAARILEEIELVHSETAREMAFARELIQLLRSRGVKVGIVTRNCRQASKISLRVSGFDDDLMMLAREDVLNAKPHPDHLLLALERLGAEPERSIMVGDHIMDIKGGKAAGMHTIGLLAPERPRDFFEKVAPDAVIESLREIIDAFNDLDS